MPLPFLAKSVQRQRPLSFLILQRAQHHVMLSNSVHAAPASCPAATPSSAPPPPMAQPASATLAAPPLPPPALPLPLLANPAVGTSWLPAGAPAPGPTSLNDLLEEGCALPAPLFCTSKSAAPAPGAAVGLGPPTASASPPPAVPASPPAATWPWGEDACFKSKEGPPGPPQPPVSCSLAEALLAAWASLPAPSTTGALGEFSSAELELGRCQGPSLPERWSSSSLSVAIMPLLSHPSGHSTRQVDQKEGREPLQTPRQPWTPRK